jgi:hypothetical protein
VNVAEILSKLEALGVRMTLNGDKVRLKGSATAIAAVKGEVAARKPEIMAHLRATVNQAANCAGALMAPDGGAYLPWGPYLSRDDLRALRCELSQKIEGLAEVECWDEQHLDDVLKRAMSGPLSALLPDLHYFTARLAVATAEVSAHRTFGYRVQQKMARGQ